MKVQKSIFERFAYFGDRGLAKKRLWIITGIVFALCIAAIISVWKWSEPAVVASSTGNALEITGSSKEAIASLQEIIHADTQSFVYFYENNCEPCKRLEPTIFARAKEKEVTVYRFNLSAYRDALALKNEKGLPLVQFYKELPAVAYYNQGWLIAWIEGDEAKTGMDEFYDHFRFGADD